MLDDVEHELVVEEPDEVEAAEAGGAAEGEVPGDYKMMTFSLRCPLPDNHYY